MLPTTVGEFIKILRKNNQLIDIEVEVDARLEIAEIHRRVIADGGPALLFRQVRGKKFPVITNMFGSGQRIELAFGGQDTVNQVAQLVDFLTTMPPSLSDVWQQRRSIVQLIKSLVSLGRPSKLPFIQIDNPDVGNILPATTSWHSDGGAFLTLPLVHTCGNGKDNLGIYRMQIHDESELGMHLQIGKGGGYHLYHAEQQGRDLAANVYLGGPPALILAAIAPLPENVSEFILASLIIGKKLTKTTNPFGELDLLKSVEFCLSGIIPAGVRRAEGPFGDHYGYNSLRHDFPVFRPRVLWHKKDAVFPATVVGKPRQEDFFLGNYLQQLLLPIIPVVMPAVRDLWSYGETGYHSLASCVLSERYEREALTTAFRILGEGQLSLTKFLLCLDKPIDLRDFRQVLEYILRRADFANDLYIFAKTAMDTLDYTGESLNRGSKGLLIGIGQPCRELPTNKPSLSTTLIDQLEIFCRGCLVISGKSHDNNPQLATAIANQSPLTDWPLIILVDNANNSAASVNNFLWTTFTRFNPATDIYARQVEVKHHKISYTQPIVIDARMKSWYPPELECDSTTKRLVDRRWSEYFPICRDPLKSFDKG